MFDEPYLHFQFEDMCSADRPTMTSRTEWRKG
jgi:hypothetical protein